MFTATTGNMSALDYLLRVCSMLRRAHLSTYSYTIAKLARPQPPVVLCLDLPPTHQSLSHGMLRLEVVSLVVRIRVSRQVDF